MNSVAIEHTTLALPWYAPGEDDIEPALLAEFTPRRAPVYPYTLREVIQFEKEERVFEALTLENEFLKLTILPELGGRIYSAFDKVHRQEMFYQCEEVVFDQYFIIPIYNRTQSYVVSDKIANIQRSTFTDFNLMTVELA